MKKLWLLLLLMIPCVAFTQNNKIDTSNSYKELSSEYDLSKWEITPIKKQKKAIIPFIVAILILAAIFKVFIDKPHHTKEQRMVNIGKFILVTVILLFMGIWWFFVLINRDNDDFFKNNATQVYMWCSIIIAVIIFFPVSKRKDEDSDSED